VLWGLKFGSKKVPKEKKEGNSSVVLPCAG